mmetsp:Transcript_45757/g.83812  ORF Transcript_45757/g.83812 Transcript_45757/m.83812 type:complete len:332 (-) Transcript_45757:255-1250(-)
MSMEHRQSVTPELTVHNASEAIEFYEKALGATIKRKEAVEGDPKKRLMHAMLQMPGGGDVMVHDDFPDWSPDGQLKTPVALGGTPVIINLALATPAELDAVVDRAMKHAMQVLCPPTDMFWGDRHAMLKDPYGHAWSLVSPLPEDRKSAVASKVPKGDGQEFVEEYNKDSGKQAEGGPPPKKPRVCFATIKAEHTIAAVTDKVFSTWVEKHRQIQPLPEGSSVVFDKDVKYEAGALEQSSVRAADGSPMCSFEERVVYLEAGSRVVWHSVCKMPSGEKLSTSLSTVEFLPSGASTNVHLTEQVTWFKQALLDEHKSGLQRHLENLSKAVLS